MIFEGNTITGVQIGLKGDGGNLNLDNVLDNNTFDPGSTVIGNNIRLPQGGLPPFTTSRKTNTTLKFRKPLKMQTTVTPSRGGPGHITRN